MYPHMRTSLLRNGPLRQLPPPSASRTRSADASEAEAAEVLSSPTQQSPPHGVQRHVSLSFSETTEPTVADARGHGGWRLANEELSTPPSSVHFADNSDTEPAPHPPSEEVSSPLVYAPVADASSLGTSPRLGNHATAQQRVAGTGRAVLPSDSEEESPLFYPEVGVLEASCSTSNTDARPYITGPYEDEEEEEVVGNDDDGAGGVRPGSDGTVDGGLQPRTSRKLVYSARGTVMSPHSSVDTLAACTVAAARAAADRPSRVLPPPPPPTADLRHTPPPPPPTSALDAEGGSAVVSTTSRLKPAHGSSAFSADMQSDGVVGSRRSSSTAPRSAPTSPLARYPRGSYADVTSSATEAGLVRSTREGNSLAQHQHWLRQWGTSNSVSTDGRRSGLSPATEVLAGAAMAAEAAATSTPGYTFFSTQLPPPEDRRAHIYELAKALRGEGSRSVSATTPALGEGLLASPSLEVDIGALVSPVLPPVALRADDGHHEGEALVQTYVEEHGDEGEAALASYTAPVDTSLSIGDTDTVACGDVAVFLSRGTPIVATLPTGAPCMPGKAQAAAQGNSEAAGPLLMEPNSSSNCDNWSKTMTTEGIAFAGAVPGSLTLDSSASPMSTPSTAQRRRPPPRMLCPPTPSPSRSRSTGGAHDLLLNDTAAADPDVTDSDRAAVEQSLFSGQSLLTAAAPLPSVSRVATSAEGVSAASATVGEVVAVSHDFGSVSTATSRAVAAAATSPGASTAAVADSAVTTLCASPGWSLSVSAAPPGIADVVAVVSDDAAAADGLDDSAASAAVARADRDATMSDVGTSSPTTSCAGDEGAEPGEAEEEEGYGRHEQRVEEPLVAPEVPVCVGEVGTAPLPPLSARGCSRRRPSSESVHCADVEAQPQPLHDKAEWGTTAAAEATGEAAVQPLKEEQGEVNELEDAADVMVDSTECGAPSSWSHGGTASGTAAPRCPAAAQQQQHRDPSDPTAFTTASPSAASPSPIRPPSAEGSGDDEAHLLRHWPVAVSYRHKETNALLQTATTSSMEAGTEDGDEEAHLLYTDDGVSASRPAYVAEARDGERTWRSELLTGMYDDDTHPIDHHDVGSSPSLPIAEDKDVDGDEESAAAAAQTPVEEALCRVEAKNAVLRLALAAATERTNAAEASRRAREVECAELHALADRLHAELAAAQAAARARAPGPRVEASAQTTDTTRVDDAVMWQQRHDALALELAAVKGTVAEQLAVLDRLGLQPPFAEEEVSAAERRVRRVRVANVGGTVTHIGRGDTSLLDTPIRPLCVNDSPCAATAKSKLATAGGGDGSHATIAALLDQRRQRRLQQSASTVSSGAARSPPVLCEQLPRGDAALADKENNPRVQT